MPCQRSRERVGANPSLPPATHAVGPALATASLLTPIIAAILGFGRAGPRSSLARASDCYANLAAA
jgi:hypothetical protein